MKIWFPHKMIIIFGFLGEKWSSLEIFSILSSSEQIYQGLQLNQLYRNLYGEMSFSSQWRHHYLSQNIKKFTQITKKQLLSRGDLPLDRRQKAEGKVLDGSLFFKRRLGIEDFKCSILGWWFLRYLEIIFWIFEKFELKN